MKPPSPLFFLLAFTCLMLGIISALEDSHTYIIHIDQSHKPSAFSTHRTWYKSMLGSLSSSHDGGGPMLDVENMLIYSYNHVMHGFSARLTRTQLYQMQKHPAHLATYPESYGKLFTTYTPKYLGLRSNSGLWPAASYGQDVIIGVFDTGIWPESESFLDHGMTPVPERWKGECEKGTEFNSSHCNRKLIGARSFSKGLIAAGKNISKQDYDSARDNFGHGTHTSSTAAGAAVFGADHFGYAKGTAKGIAPSARLAMYKVLFLGDTYESAATDVLAAMDQAITDGVDIMSLSLAFDFSPYFEDVIAIGALSAVEKGIFVSCSAGNDGDPYSTYNGAPWITTVGAGTVERDFVASVTLSDELTVEGKSYYPESIYIDGIPLYYGKGNEKKASCDNMALDPLEVAGKVVYCETTNNSDVVWQIWEANRTGAIAGIFEEDSTDNSPYNTYFPTLILEGDDAVHAKEYAMNNENITVRMKFVITRFGLKPAPQVAEFSSRGPDPVTPTVLKPDILAPGVDVLAAWAPITPMVYNGRHNLASDYLLLSGTSMSAPHVAGVAALLRAVHPEWSPAAIRSAMMTTARTVDNTGSAIRDQATGLPCTPLAFGAGHINPNKAMDPGLVYDLEFQDYINFICSLGYNATEMSALIRNSTWVCPESSPELNYPSFMAIFPSSSDLMQRNFTRVVTNVGGDAAVYRATVEVPKGIQIQVKPDSLTFSSKNQKLEFVLNIEVDKEVWSGGNNVSYGYLRWVDQQMAHVVSSPVVVMAT